MFFASRPFVSNAAMHKYMVKYRAVAVAVAVAVSGGGAVAVAVAGFTKRFFNHISKDFLINVWGDAHCRCGCCHLSRFPSHFVSGLFHVFLPPSQAI